jgi:glycosyltransferase involved in cell wall biosynthesis
LAVPSQSIWILNHYAGTATSPSTRHYDLARQLVRKGHRVTIFASSFHYQKLVEEHLAPGQTWSSEDHEGVRFIWIRTFPYKRNDWRRVLNMLSYAWRVVRVAMALKERPDAIVGSSVHPFAVFSAYVLSRRTRSRFLFEVRDLWPQSLVDAGAWKEKSPVTWAFRALEKFLYHKADLIITLLPYAHQYITRLGVSREKIVWIPNGADLTRYERLKPYDGGARPEFTIMYLGAHGRMNALDVILDAAALIRDRGRSGIRFVFVGDGPAKADLIRYADEKSLRNVDFRGPVPKSDLADVMGEADAFAFNLEDLPFNYGVSSNKLFDYLSSGRPVLFAGNTANNPVTEAGAGFGVPARSPEQFAEAVLNLIALTPAERMEMGRRGVAYMKANHDIRVLANAFESAVSPQRASLP